PAPVNGQDLVRHRVPLDVEPAPAAGRMDPALAKLAFRVIAHEEEVGPFDIGKRIRVRRPRDVSLAAVAELGLVANPAPGAGEAQHQCATAAAPCSSINAPETKRSRLKGALIGCGASLAIV